MLPWQHHPSRYGRCGGHPERSRCLHQESQSGHLWTPLVGRLFQGLCPLGPQQLLALQDSQWGPGDWCAGCELYLPPSHPPLYSPPTHPSMPLPPTPLCPSHPLCLTLFCIAKINTKLSFPVGHFVPSSCPYLHSLFTSCFLPSQKVFFLPFSDTIITCFKDDSIHAWETDALEYKYLLPTTPGPSPHYRAFAASQDGKVLVGGGRSSLLHVWSTEAHSLTRVIQLPSKVRQVRQLFFLVEPCDAGASQILGVLAQDGILRLINIHTCKLVFQMGSSDQVW